VQPGAHHGKNAGRSTGTPIRTALIGGAALFAAESASAQDGGQQTQPAPKYSAANAVAQADDAFGGAVGLEAVGIYTETDVRGFNPQKAGNARIDGLYFDQLTVFPGRVRQGVDIRVGFPALSFASPAPTGILAHRLRPVGDDFTVNLGLHPLQYGGLLKESYAQVPIVRGGFGIGIGAGHNHAFNADGSVYSVANYGIIARIRIGPAEIKPFYGGFSQYTADARPITIALGPTVPRLPKAGRYLGQRWANNANDNIVAGIIFRTPLIGTLGFRGGFFQSRLNRTHNYTELFAVRDATTLASHRIVIDPKQDSRANSWDAMLYYSFGKDRLRHTLMLQYKGRQRHIESGGANAFTYCDEDPGNDADPIEPIGPCMVRYGERDRHAKPETDFGKVSIGKLRQDNVTLGYIGRMAGVGQVNLGITRTRYRASFRGPLGTTRSSARPWLYNASIMIQPARHVALYAGYVTGLEDIGSAPENARNRNEQLPATKTRQIDAGIRVDVGKVQLVASLFEIKKPYFSFDAAGDFTQVGNLSHRGIEASVAGKLTSRLQILGGAVLMKPRASGPAIKSGLLGKLPTGTPKLHARVDLNYRTDIFRGLTLTATLLHDSRRALSAQPYAELGGKQLMLPAVTTFDVGARQNFHIGKTSFSYRITIHNIFNKKSWKVIAPNSVQQDEVRRYNVYLYVDF
jgi:iron complex outermembrane receptor protein